ncbi:MAG: protein-glutamate O-methyltransferase CheR [Deltaproteobacteria bacterium]|nr:protein-glutamate O-methyltransferase CheR [Deltaproteobacteria bacterium]
MGDQEDRVFQLLLRKIREERGLDFTQYRPTCLKRRIETRLRVNRINNYLEYMGLLNRSPEEYERLLDATTINVTEFFRDPPVWEVLKNRLLPEIIQDRKNEGSSAIRVWSAGCSGGEEVYSLSILFHELLGEVVSRQSSVVRKTEDSRLTTDDFRVEIHGTDIDKGSLKKAALGEYGQESLKNMDPLLLSKYFLPTGKSFAISDSIRISAQFRTHNMITDPPLKDMSLIICRNVLIYFTRELQVKVLENFHRSLRKDGYLVIGKSESLWGGTNKRFEVWDSTERIYKKKTDD